MNPTTTIQIKAYTRADGTRVKAHKSTVRRVPNSSQVKGPTAGPVNTAPSGSALGVKVPASSASLVVNRFEGWGASSGTQAGFELDRRTGEVWGFTEPESEKTCSRDEASGIVMRFAFERLLGKDEMKDLVSQSMDDLNSLVASFDEQWDGQNFVAVESDRGAAALAQIEAHLQAASGEPSLYEIDQAEAMQDLFAELPGWMEGIDITDYDDYRTYMDERTKETVDMNVVVGEDSWAAHLAAMDELQVLVTEFDAREESLKELRDPAEVARLEALVKLYDERMHDGPGRPEFDGWVRELDEYVSSTREA